MITSGINKMHDKLATKNKTNTLTPPTPKKIKINPTRKSMLKTERAT